MKYNMIICNGQIHILYGSIISTNEKDKRYVYTVKYNETK